MITIQILGLDQFVVGNYSKRHSANLAQLYESDEDLINFYAPNSMVFHAGVEQTSWNTIVIVRAPMKFELLESKVAEYLLKTLSEFSINIELEFEYFAPGHRYESINDAYPRYISGSNIRDDDEEDGPEMEISLSQGEGEEPNPEDPESIYLGDAFAGFDEKLEEAKKGK